MLGFFRIRVIVIDGCQHGVHLLLILLRLCVGLIIVVLDQQLYQWMDIDISRTGLFEQPLVGQLQTLMLDIVLGLGCEWRKEYSSIRAS